VVEAVGDVEAAVRAQGHAGRVEEGRGGGWSIQVADGTRSGKDHGVEGDPAVGPGVEGVRQEPPVGQVDVDLIVVRVGEVHQAARVDGQPEGLGDPEQADVVGVACELHDAVQVVWRR